MNKPQLISSLEMFRGNILTVSLDRISEEGAEYEREIVHHPGSAVIVPYFDNGTIALVSQYRHAAGQKMLELPAGSFERGETAEECAAREIREEVGYSAEKLEKMTEFYVSPGFLTETMTVFLATGLSRDPLAGDADEFIDVRLVPLSEAAEMVRSNGFADAKTMVGILFAEMRFSKGL